jgi:hypothetical protein
MKPMFYWLDTASLPKFPSLDRNLRVDVAVNGGDDKALWAYGYRSNYSPPHMPDR